MTDVALAMDCFSDITFVDDAASETQRTFRGCRVAGTPDVLTLLKEEGYPWVHVSIGSNEARARCFATALEAGLTPATLMHPSAVINTGAIIEHDCDIGDHAHISPGVVLSGAVSVGRFAHIGAGATVLPGTQIGDGAVVGAGAVVLRSVPAWDKSPDHFPPTSANRSRSFGFFRTLAKASHKVYLK